MGRFLIVGIWQNIVLLDFHRGFHNNFPQIPFFPVRDKLLEICYLTCDLWLYFLLQHLHIFDVYQSLLNFLVVVIFYEFEILQYLIKLAVANA